MESRTLFVAFLAVATGVDAATLVEDFEDPFPAWESGWLALNSNVHNYYGNGSTLGDGYLWIDDGDGINGPGEPLEIAFEYAFGLSLTSLSIDIDTYVDTSIQVYDISGGVILDSMLDVDAGFETVSVLSSSGISGFSLFGTDPVEGSTTIDNVVAVTGVVPLPAAVWLFGLGLLVLTGAAARKSRS